MTIVLCGDCLELLDKSTLMRHGVGAEFALTFLGPPLIRARITPSLMTSCTPSSIGNGLRKSAPKSTPSRRRAAPSTSCIGIKTVSRFCASCGRQVRRCRTSSSGRSIPLPCPIPSDMAKPTKSSPSPRRDESPAFSIAFALTLLWVPSIAMSGSTGCSSPMSGTTFGS